MQEDLQRKGNENFCRLAAPLQQPGRSARLGGFGKDEGFYRERGIDILKDAVTLPGVSLHYLLRGTIERGTDLYSPGKEAYDMLKNAMVGGPSIVFKRHHEAGVTQIMPHRYTKTKTCKKIIGYDANALYLSTMLREMPCGKEEVVH